MQENSHSLLHIVQVEIIPPCLDLAILKLKDAHQKQVILLFSTRKAINPFGEHNAVVRGYAQGDDVDGEKGQESGHGFLDTLNSVTGCKGRWHIIIYGVGSKPPFNFSPTILFVESREKGQKIQNDFFIVVGRGSIRARSKIGELEFVFHLGSRMKADTAIMNTRLKTRSYVAVLGSGGLDCLIISEIDGAYLGTYRCRPKWCTVFHRTVHTGHTLRNANHFLMQVLLCCLSPPRRVIFGALCGVLVDRVNGLSCERRARYCHRIPVLTRVRLESDCTCLTGAAVEISGAKTALSHSGTSDAGKIHTSISTSRNKTLRRQ